MSSTVLKSLFFATAVFTLTPTIAQRPPIRLKGLCQNLVLDHVDYTYDCQDEFMRVDWDNGRINYAFWTKSKTMITFAGHGEESVIERFYSFTSIDKIYVNNTELSVSGTCSLLGNTDLGVTVSCRSSDDDRRYSSLFFSVGLQK